MPPARATSPGDLWVTTEPQAGDRLWCRREDRRMDVKAPTAHLRTSEKPTASQISRLQPARTSLLQRKCACGGSPGPSGECEECRKKRLSFQRKTPTRELGTRNESSVPLIVHEVLRSSGQPLDA